MNKTSFRANKVKGMEPIFTPNMFLLYWQSWKKMYVNFTIMHLFVLAHHTKFLKVLKLVLGMALQVTNFKQHERFGNEFNLPCRGWLCLWPHPKVLFITLQGAYFEVFTVINYHLTKSQPMSIEVTLFVRGITETDLFFVGPAVGWAPMCNFKESRTNWALAKRRRWG